VQKDPTEAFELEQSPSIFEKYEDAEDEICEKPRSIELEKKCSDMTVHDKNDVYSDSD
jgi:hypothetical protein